MVTSNGVIDLFPMARTIYGRAVADVIRDEAERLGARRVFLLASNSLAANTSAVAEIERELGKRHAATFRGIPAHTPESKVLEAASAACDAKCDLLVSIGGGSISDAAKIMVSCLEFGAYTPEK
jgi:maleylacetate reductase